ncbi:MAG: ABC transporter substrate-binding protein [Chloroflexaceae bacterium]|nr:ABC transporter substrate-binding protein [Chloroflexaceae bacterium]
MQPFVRFIRFIRSIRRSLAGLVLVFSTLTLSVGVACGQASAPPIQLAQNITDGCVIRGAYDPQQDYFPQKVDLDYSSAWNVEYYRNYKVINVTNPWTGASETFQYVLVQCGTPAPSEEDYPDAQFIEVPIDTIVMLSTTYLPHLVDLEVLDSLVGIETIDYVNSQEVIDRYHQGNIAEVGSGAGVNIEQILDLDPDVVMASGSGVPEYDTHPTLIENGIAAAINADWMEQSPLGRAEWVKFTAMFYNREAQSSRLFDDIEQRYTDLMNQIQNVSDRPTVFNNLPWQGTWYVPGGQSFSAQMMDDAGASYLWRDNNSTGSLALDFEAVYERAIDADFWLIFGQGMQGIDDLVASDERFGDFTAVQRGRVYANDARVNANGGNDYFESGVVNPDAVLADLVKIFHPELVPDHTLTYYRRLTPSSSDEFSSRIFLPLIKRQ